MADERNMLSDKLLTSNNSDYRDNEDNDNNDDDNNIEEYNDDNYEGINCILSTTDRVNGTSHNNSGLTQDISTIQINTNEADQLAAYAEFCEAVLQELPVKKRKIWQKKLQILKSNEGMSDYLVFKYFS